MDKEDIRKAIRAIVEDMIPIQTRWGTVKSVDEESDMCVVTGNNDIQYSDVLLNIGEGITEVPEEGSRVLIGLAENIKEAAFLILIEKVKSVRIRGGKLGGLPIIGELKAQLQKLQTEINTLKTATGTAISVYSGALDGGASAGTFNAVVLPQIDLSKLENEKVTQG